MLGKPEKERRTSLYNSVKPLFHINNKFPREELTLVASTTAYVIDLITRVTRRDDKMAHFDNGVVLSTSFYGLEINNQRYYGFCNY